MPRISDSRMVVILLAIAALVVIAFILGRLLEEW
jgi:hypothetical protein